MVLTKFVEGRSQAEAKRFRDEQNKTADAKLYAERKARNQKIVQKVKQEFKTNPFKNQKPTSQISKGYNKVVKRFGYKKQLSSSLMKDFTGGSSNSQGQTRRVGRPAMSFKHTSPFTGRPITAPQFYKEVRLFKRQQVVLADRVQQARINQLARQGMTPQQLAQIQARQQQIQSQNMPPRQMSNQPQIMRQNPPNQVPQQNIPQRSIWNRSEGQIVQDAGLFGPRLIKIGRPESFWN